VVTRADAAHVLGSIALQVRETNLPYFWCKSALLLVQICNIFGTNLAYFGYKLAIFLVQICHDFGKNLDRIMGIDSRKIVRPRGARPR